MDYLCLLDESETGAGVLDPFFVYGAVLVPVATSTQLQLDIEAARAAAGVPPGTALKWNMAVPQGSSAARLLRAKQAVISAAGRARAELFVSIVRKEIAAGRRTQGEMHLYGANTVLPAVGAALGERSAMSFFLFDRLPATSANDSFRYLGRRMDHGLSRLDQAPGLPHATGFGFVNCDSTRLASALDIPLGAFTRCLNAQGSGLAGTVSAAVLPLLSRDQSGRVWERGVRLRPLIVNTPAYQPSYTRVVARLTQLGLR